MNKKESSMGEEWNQKGKKKKRWLIWVPVLVLVLAGACVWIYLWKFQKKEDTDSTTVDITLEENQSIVYGQIEEINGNEMSYYVVNVTEGTSGDSTGEMPSVAEGESGGFGGNRGEMPSMAEGESGDFSGGFGGNSGEMPSMAEGETGDFSGGFGGNSGEMPSMAEGESGEASGGESSYEVTDELVTVTIPVGTTVTTKLGAETTFSRLAAGDVIEMVVETVDGEETIVGIWILE